MPIPFLLWYCTCHVPFCFLFWYCTCHKTILFPVLMLTCHILILFPVLVLQIPHAILLPVLLLHISIPFPVWYCTSQIPFYFVFWHSTSHRQSYFLFCYCTCDITILYPVLSLYHYILSFDSPLFTLHSISSLVTALVTWLLYLQFSYCTWSLTTFISCAVTALVICHTMYFLLW